jgi:hypothetical protein
MNCQRAREIFPELLDSRTTSPAAKPQDEPRRSPTGEGGPHLDARAHLASCPDCQREFSALSQTLTALDTMPAPQPSSRLRKNFYAMLEEEKHSAASMRAATEREYRARQVTLWRWVLAPLGACALVAVGYVAGQRTALPAANPAENVALNAKVQRLEDQITKMGNVVATSLLQQNQRPANDRLRTVFASATQETPTEKATNDLISALAFDPSPNVRLRALEGLSKHSESELVRTAVLTSLSREENPLVQISMIDFLAAAQERDAKPVLERMSASDATDTNVRSAARRALTEL